MQAIGENRLHVQAGAHCILHLHGPSYLEAGGIYKRPRQLTLRGRYQHIVSVRYGKTVESGIVLVGAGFVFDFAILLLLGSDQSQLRLQPFFGLQFCYLHIKN